MNRAPLRAGDISVVNLNMFVITLKKAHSYLSFWIIHHNMLNPVETILGKMKAVLKQRMRGPQVQPPRVGEQRLAYVQWLIDEFMGLITVQDIVNSCQHAQGFFRTGHGSGSMNLYTWHLYYNISRTIQLVSVVLLWLFCYRLFVWFLLYCRIDM